MQVLGNDLILGTTADGRPLRLTREQRGMHQWICGATGTGKSKCLENLIRQDLLSWHRHRCGLILFDKHGALFDGVMNWIAASGLRHLPVVPIDLRRGDWSVSYNPLRRRVTGDPAVIVGSIARAIVHAWGQGNMDDTPRLAKWLPTVLGTLYEQEHLLVDALRLFDNPELRRSMTADIQNVVARSVWRFADTLRPAEFHEEVSSTANRLLRFLGTQSMRAMLCQSGPSLDLSAALEQGSIILVSLSTAGTQIDAEDSRTLGSMLLSDLWAAAQARGKRDEGREGVKPFYCYIDEFQEYMTPVMAETLDQARGFGLHLTLAQQFPSQLTGRGELGKLIFNSVMANARTKVVFQLDHPEDLPMLALWLGRQEIDIDQVKFQHYSTKVMGHALTYLPSVNLGRSETNGENWSDTHTDGTSSSQASAWSHSDTAGDTTGLSISADPDTDSENTTQTESHSSSSSDSFTAGQTDGESASDSKSRGGSRAVGHSQGISLSPMLFPIMGQEASPPIFRSIEEQLFRFTQVLAAQPRQHAMARLAGNNGIMHLTK